jgi:outer membrane autotransporter protein
MSYVDTGTQSQALDAGDASVWGRAYGTHSWVGSDGNDASFETGSGGFQAGVDDWFGDFRLGLMFNAGRTSFSSADRGASVNSNDYGLGVYGGTHWGATGFSFGATSGRHDVDSIRTVSFPGFVETLQANYAANTTQLFGEVNHAIDLGGTTLQPFGQLAYVHNTTEGFTETGGTAALSVDQANADALFTTLGLRIGGAFVLDEGMKVTAKAGAGWRHAFADDFRSTNAFGTGSDFTVTSSPIAQDALALEASLNFEVSPTVSLGLNYAGQLAGEAQDHDISAKFAVKF